MKIRHCLAFGAGLLFAFSPSALQAQSSTPGTSGGGSLSSSAAGASGGSTGGNAAGGSAGGGGATSASSLSGTSSFATGVATQAISSTGSTSATSIPSNANPWGATYVNPMSIGNPINWANTFGQLAKNTGTMGQGLYLANATNTTSSSAASTTTNAGTGFNTGPVPRNPSYRTALGRKLPLVAHSAKDLDATLRASIARSEYIPSKKDIQVDVASGGLVILRGKVASDDERRLVEGMMRLTPGVQNVQNELRAPPAPKESE